MPPPPDDFVPLCRITRAHSLGGDVIIDAFHDPKTLMGYGTLTTAEGRSFSIKKSRPQGKSWALHLETINTRTDAEALRGLILGITRSRLPPVVEEDTWYHTDLLGCTVLDQETSEILGHVVAVQNYGAGDFFELKTPAGKDITLPLIPEAVIAIHLPEKQILACSRFCL
jgi:16S rRNA processing protein RimM